MQCSVEWNGPDGMLFVSRTGSGHSITMDGAPEGGGNNLAARPMELILSGTGGCAAYDVVFILKKGRHQVLRCVVNLTATRATSDPKVFTQINFEFIVSGKQLPAAVVERAVQLSHEKYCSAVAMLNKTAQISHTVKVIEV